MVRSESGSIFGQPQIRLEGREGFTGKVQVCFSSGSMFPIKRRRPMTRFDRHALSCILLRALDEIDSGTATATEATGLSRAELREILTQSFPAINISAFALARAADPEPDMEEQLLLDLLLAHARPGDPVSTSFAKIIAHRAMHTDCLWQDLGLFDCDELSRLLATHFPALASNTENMRWEKYIYRNVGKTEGRFHVQRSGQDCSDFDAYLGPEEGDIHPARGASGPDVN